MGFDDIKIELFKDEPVPEIASEGIVVEETDILLYLAAADQLNGGLGNGFVQLEFHPDSNKSLTGTELPAGQFRIVFKGSWFREPGHDLEEYWEIVDSLSEKTD